ncbi:hypothetical protein Ahy_B08g091944 [Arachis hypogaea]|uniref:SWIM-type domain-containing protein n=1 Tax=Arachis hypogaea TaxID=3818 RepID=A0A444Y2Y8_ARAHY|nr:hypothetical protein Ahy_B08g091944 [Arachis hypogaea]
MHCVHFLCKVALSELTKRSAFALEWAPTSSLASPNLANSLCYRSALFRLALTQQSRLEREKRESNKWRPLPIGDDAENVYEVQCLLMKVSGFRKSCKLSQLTGLPCRHARAALAYQNRRSEEYAHN